MSTNPQVWVAAFCTLAVYSYLYKENFFYRLAEYSLVALYTSYTIALYWHNYLKPYWKTYFIEEKQYYFAVMGFFGLLLYARYLPPKYQWLARYPVAAYVGWGLGGQLARAPRPAMTQAIDSMRKLTSVNNVLFFLFFLAAMTYFFFTVGKQSKLLVGSSKFGRYVLMVAFGAAFGNTVQGRISLFLNRLSFLLTDWLGIKI